MSSLKNNPARDGGPDLEPPESSPDLPGQGQPREGETAPSTLEELVKKNIKWSQVIYEQNRRISRRLTLMAVGNYVRLALLLAPIILAAIYLPPLIRDLLETYGGLFGSADGAASPVGDLGRLLRQYGRQ
ncbi:MAG: hypothetical protein UY92_C0013G0009 [Candidatus Magasanikbacteria bacterium GW2011_GWA2_56_11]|uniref:Uncharacterized protein n=1 Tax=Candidatus Magasanikbacteria bacterium GW2011_GWA2_56_11 TaxID=1619044 RepID=A0A0G1YF48_9BACT|nr:MAG: hypothetical protein UY92_C0013G0009 [Candidatus Magasanikbacteria bacterium GW2011_GWA2_56_11]